MTFWCHVHRKLLPTCDDSIRVEVILRLSRLTFAMLLHSVAGACSGAYRSWKPKSHASINGADSFGAAKTQVNKCTLQIDGG